MIKDDRTPLEEYEMMEHQSLMTEAEEGDGGILMTGHTSYSRLDFSEASRCRRVSYGKIILVLSLLLNVFLVSVISSRPHLCSQEASEVSKYAKLPQNVPVVIGPENGGNQTEEDRLWDIETNYDRGMVALSDDTVEQMGLPASQRFPWDDSKSVYLLNAYHNLHCLKLLRTALNEYHLRDAEGRQSGPGQEKQQQQKKKQTWPWGHVLHCLRVLRADVLCHADDTPRRVGLDQPPKKTGLGQARLCRDWARLERWADDHNACWSHVDPAADDRFPELDRYRHCPAGSPYRHDAETKWLSGGGVGGDGDNKVGG